jgi:hypothetical protein
MNCPWNGVSATPGTTSGRPLPALLDWCIPVLEHGVVHLTHPRYFGHFNPSVTFASVVADTLVAMYNPQLATWRTSPAANEIERHTLSWLAGKFGFPSDASANFTTGGAESNLSAAIVALTRAFPEYGERGLRHRFLGRHARCGETRRGQTRRGQTRQDPQASPRKRGCHVLRSRLPRKAQQEATIQPERCSRIGSVAALKHASLIVLSLIRIKRLGSRLELRNAVRRHVLHRQARFATEESHVPEHIGQPILEFAGLRLRQCQFA